MDGSCCQCQTLILLRGININAFCIYQLQNMYIVTLNKIQFHQENVILFPATTSGTRIYTAVQTH